MVFVPSKIIFAVFASSNPAALGAKINQLYPADSIQIAPGQWLIAAEGTAKDISDKLGISVDEKGDPTGSASGAAMVASISGYYGRQASNIWEWIKAKWQG